MKKIVIDTDPGIDDSMAILTALAAPMLDVLALTTTFGNASVETTTQNALYLAERFATDLPVARGAPVPLAVPPGPYPDFVHGKYGLGDVRAPQVKQKPVEASAAEMLVELVNENPGEVTLVALGPLTNLAMALQIEPDFHNQVAGVVTMGGALGVRGCGGNVSPVAEANYFGDPHAADLVFSAPWSVTMVGLDVTMETRMAPELVAKLAAVAGDAGAFISETARFYRGFYESNEGRPDYPVHDASAIACVMAPDLYQYQSGSVRVATEGLCRGMTIQVPEPGRYPPGFWTDVPEQRVCTDADSSKVLSLIVDTLCQRQ